MGGPDDRGGIACEQSQMKVQRKHVIYGYLLLTQAVKSWLLRRKGI
ncbi:MAG TPA: hypothetical protein VN903_04290 [Polyangia bacterium]|nr:hypothetical protein [Polyangia bacterium]